MINLQEIKTVIKEEKLSDENICIHSSIKSFGGLEKGPETIIEAFLEENCTVIVPTFSYDFQVMPPDDQKLIQNGWDYVLDEDDCRDDIFSVNSTEISADMGAFPKAIVNTKGRIRGNHPLNSFSAIGKNAKKMIEGQSPADVYFPLEKLIDENGYVILMGVDYRSLTLLHLAEKNSGRNLFKRWVKNDQGKTVMADIGSCSDGFNNFSEYFDRSDFVKERKVGKSLWKIIKARQALLQAAEIIKNNPEVTMCSDKCTRCTDAVKGGPVNGSELAVLK